MVNWHDPTVVAEDSQGFVKAAHFCAGVIIWEIFSTFNYEWRFYSGKRPFRWPILLYAVTRLFALATGMSYLIGLNVNTELNCGAWLISTTLFGDLSLISASALLALRTIAVWNRKIYIVVPVAATWLAGSIVELYNGTRTSGAIAWDQTSRACASTDDPQTGRWYATAAVTSDAIILPIMLVGLFRIHSEGRLWKYIFVQSVIWVMFLMAAEIPLLVFTWLDLNGAMNLIYQPIAALIMVIAATRLHRNLSTFLTGPITYSTTQPDTTFRAAVPLMQSAPPVRSSHVVVDLRAHAHAPMDDKGRDTTSGAEVSSTDDKPVCEDMHAV